MKNILITGAPAGFGKAIAEKLAVKGNRLIVTGRTKASWIKLLNILMKKRKLPPFHWFLIYKT